MDGSLSEVGGVEAEGAGKINKEKPNHVVIRTLQTGLAKRG